MRLMILDLIFALTVAAVCTSPLMLATISVFSYNRRKRNHNRAHNLATLTLTERHGRAHTRKR